MKKFLIGMLCLAMCGSVALTSCKEKEVEEEVKDEKAVVLDFAKDFVEEAPVFEYHFSGDEAILVAYHPENAKDGEVLATDIVLPENPIRMKTETVETPAVVDGKNVIIKEKVEVQHERTYTLTEIDAGVFAGNTEITSIVIPDTVKVIGTGAFQGCTSLESVKLPAALEKINDFTFNGCSSLETLNIPEGVASVGMFAFGEYFDQIPWYKNLTDASVIVGDGVLLKYNGFAPVVTYGEEVKSVAYYAFTDSAAKTITFTNATEDFDDQAFYRSTAVVRLPSTSKKATDLKMNNVKVETYEVAE